MKWYLKVVRDNFANFSGRARRQEYWMFVLINILITIGLSFTFSYLSEITEVREIALVPFVYILGILIPYLALFVRRLHDSGNSGWMCLIYFIPLVGPIWLFVLLVTEGDRGSNKYGSDPKKSNGNFSKVTHDILDVDLLDD